MSRFINTLRECEGEDIFAGGRSCVILLIDCIQSCLPGQSYLVLEMKGKIKSTALSFYFENVISRPCLYGGSRIGSRPLPLPNTSDRTIGYVSLRRTQCRVSTPLSIILSRTKLQVHELLVLPRLCIPENCKLIRSHGDQHSCA